MNEHKAIVRELVERIEGVVGTHFEFEIKGHNHKKTLVVEVDFDLDPNSTHFSRAKLESIENTFETVIREENSEVISKLKIVSRTKPSMDKIADTTTGHGATSTKGASADLRSPPN